MRAAWVLFIVGNVADALTFARMPNALVQVTENSPIARALGPSLMTGVIVKGFLVLVALVGIALLRKADSPRLAPLVPAFFGAVALLGAWTNLVAWPL